MRYTAGRLNRAWLIITGSVLLLGGGLAVATGLGVLEGRSLLAWLFEPLISVRGRM